MSGDASDTAFWMAYHRASESEGPDPIIRDPFARALAGERGRRVVETLPAALKRGWPIAVRTRVYDEMILDAVRSREVSAVLNLGAGLDARPYRLDLPGDLAWVQADLPAVLHHKTQVLSSAAPSCSVQRFPVDLADAGQLHGLLERMGHEHDRVFVLTEGVLAYLDEARVAALGAHLRSLPGMKLWATEVLSASLLPPQSAGEVARGAGVELKFAPANGVQFFARHGWQPRRRTTFVDEATRLGRDHALTAEMRTVFREAVSYVLLEPPRDTIGIR